VPTKRISERNRLTLSKNGFGRKAGKSFRADITEIANFWG